MSAESSNAAAKRPHRRVLVIDRGTSAATGRPRRVMIVARPLCASSRSVGSSLRASSEPLWTIFMGVTVRPVQLEVKYAVRQSVAVISLEPSRQPLRHVCWHEIWLCERELRPYPLICWAFGRRRLHVIASLLGRLRDRFPTLLYGQNRLGKGKHGEGCGPIGGYDVTP
jgi:hypothetical protein